MSKEIDILYEEYKAASLRVEDYQRMHFVFYNGLLIGTVGIFTFFANAENAMLAYAFVYPYGLITFLMLIHYHYHRTLAVQGFREALEEIINFKLNPETRALSFGDLSTGYIITPSKNWGAGFFTLTSVLGMIAMIMFCNQGYELCWTKPHFYAHMTLFLIVTWFFVRSTRNTSKEARIRTINTYFKNSPVSEREAFDRG